jgi:hypothetical protein
VTREIVAAGELLDGSVRANANNTIRRRGHPLPATTTFFVTTCSVTVTRARATVPMPTSNVRPAAW